jgi:hypothetical protein
MPLVRSWRIPVLNGVFFPPSIKLLPVIALVLNLLAFLLVMISLGSPTWSSYTNVLGEFRTVGLTRDCLRESETNMVEKASSCVDLASSDGELFKSWLSATGKSNLGACIFFTVVAFLTNLLMLPLGALAAFHFVAHFWVYRVLHIALAVLSVLQPCYQFLAWVCWLQINTDIADQNGNTNVNVGGGWGTSFFLYVLDIVLMGLYVASAFFDSQFPPPFPWMGFLCSRPEEKLFDTPCCGLGPVVNTIKKVSDDGEDDGGTGENFVPTQSANAGAGAAVSNPVTGGDAPFEAGEVVIGQFDFAGEGDEDLPFTVGQRLIIKEDLGEQWYTASPEDNEDTVGSIPGNYVKRP